MTDMPGLDRLRADWQRLEQAPTDHGAAFFQSFAWCRHVADVRQRRSPDRFKLLVAVVTDGTELIGLWPLSLRLASRMWGLRNLDDPFGQLAGILCRHPDLIGPCVAAVLDRVRQDGTADAVCIANVIEGTPLHRALADVGAKASGTNQTVQVDMRGSPTFADYQPTLNAKSRKNLRNALNRLGRQGEVADVVVEAREQLVIRQTFDRRLDWMRQRGKSTDAFRDADFRPIVEGLCDAPGVSLVGFQMHLSGQPICSQWGFIHGGRYYLPTGLKRRLAQWVNAR